MIDIMNKSHDTPWEKTLDIICYLIRKFPQYYLIKIFIFLNWSLDLFGLQRILKIFLNFHVL